jgi:hypothetical protein
MLHCTIRTGVNVFWCAFTSWKLFVVGPFLRHPPNLSCSLLCVCIGNFQVKEDEMSRACNTNGGEDECKVGKPEGKRPLGMPRCTWVDNIKIDLGAIGLDGMDWINLAQDRDQWRALVRTVMNLRVGSESELYYEPTVSRPVVSWNKAPIWGLRPDFYYCLTITGFWYGAPSLMRGRVCLLQCTMYNIQYILLSQIWDQFPVFISPKNRVARLYPKALGIMFLAPSGSIKCWEVIELLYNWQLLKKGSTSWS